MERHAKFILVAGFILISVLSLVLFKLWVTPSENSADSQLYRILFRGSVSGLAVGSEVRYLGVAVGRVSDITINQQQAGHVNVAFNSEQTLPTSQLLAQLEPKGITGLSVIELRLKSEADSGLNNGFNSGQGIIPGYPSLLSQLSSSAGNVGNNANQLLNSINQIFQPDNIQHLNNSLQQLDLASANLAHASENMAELVNNLNSNSQQLHNTLTSYHQAGKQLDQQLLPSLHATAEQLQAAASSASSLLSDKHDDINRLFNQQIPSIVGISDQLSLSLQRINELASGLSNQPQQLLYGKPLPQLEIDRESE
ncbi:MlaD family protein [Dasania marina]|uniref:MlaD family protein n=1 Tax=Dasania marina TaxID=471499 RepID=UPI000361A5E7|nr:MlaD family protein [Dasania marina]